MLDLVTLYADPSDRTVGHKGYMKSLTSYLSQGCGSSLHLGPWGLWPASLHFPLPSYPANQICPPLDDTQCESPGILV